jgi:hypothetical protein
MIETSVVGGQVSLSTFKGRTGGGCEGLVSGYFDLLWIFLNEKKKPKIVVLLIFLKIFKHTKSKRL